MHHFGGPFKKSKLKTGGGVVSDEMSLQITSMADIFMILMVFLLKSYAIGLVNVNPTAGVKLPMAGAESPELNALKVEISEKAVSIEQNPVMTLESFKIAPGEVAANGTSKSMQEAFEKERKRQLLIAESNSQVQIDAKVIIIADTRTPYSTIKAVLASAAVNGYTDFKLAVVKRE